jgi:hypothetical protein
MLTVFYCCCAVLWLYGRTWRMNEAEELLMRIREASRLPKV